MKSQTFKYFTESNTTNNAFFTCLCKRFSEAKHHLFHPELFTNGLYDFRKNEHGQEYKMVDPGCDKPNDSWIIISNFFQGIIDSNTKGEILLDQALTYSQSSYFNSSVKTVTVPTTSYYAKDEVYFYHGQSNMPTYKYFLTLPFDQGVVSIKDYTHIVVTIGTEDYHYPTFKIIFTIDILDDFISIYKENLTEGNIKTIRTIRDKLKVVSRYAIKLKYISLDLLQSIFIFITTNIINPDFKEIIDKIEDIESVLPETESHNDVLTNEEINHIVKSLS